MSEPPPPPETSPPAAAPPAGPVGPPAQVLPYAGTDLPGDRPTILRAGGLLGLAACSIGLLLLLLACGGFEGVLRISWLPFLLGLAAFVLALAGANLEKSRIREDTHVLAALFAACLGIIGGLVEMTAWLGWPTFH